MFRYYFSVAVRNLLRSPVLTSLLVLAIGIGIGGSMTMLTVLHVMSNDPLPGRSDNLYRPYLDPLPIRWKPQQLGGESDSSTIAFTWTDVQALMSFNIATRQAAIAQGSLEAYSAVQGVAPRVETGVFTTRDFFPMFGLNFSSGGAWEKSADSQAEHVVVLTQSLAMRMFGNQSAIGKTATLGKQNFLVVGVVQDWNPEPIFYAPANGDHYGHADQFFIPLSTAMSLGLSVNSVLGWGENNSLTSPNVSWLELWVQLNSREQVHKYMNQLFNYASQQKAIERFERPASDAKLYGLMQWLRHVGLIPRDVLLQSLAAVGFLVVSMINIMALLLAKFMRRSGEISVRRALGARRCDIFTQFGIESALIGLVSGLFGIGFSEVGLWSVRHRPDDYARLASMDSRMLCWTVVLAIFVTIFAGLLPAWRASSIAPSIHLKSF